MNERIMQFRVGVMVLATVLITMILLLLIRGPSPLFHGTYTIYIKFNDAPGVTRDTPVRKAGIRIGHVRNVQFADDDTGVIVTADIDQDRRLYTNEQCKATSSLLMGDATLEFVRTANFIGEKAEIQNGAVLQGQLAPDMTSSIAGLQRQAAQTLDTLNTAGRDIHEVLTRVDGLLAKNEDRINHMIGDADEMMQLAKKALLASNDLLGDPKLREDLKQTIARMPVILEETRTTVERMGGTFASLEHNMQNIEGLTKPLGERGPGLIAELDTSLKKLDQLSDNMLRFSQALSDPKGSLGALLHDQELYQHVNRMAKNLDELSRDLKPILNNVWIFTDKIARHPNVLGVEGALKKDTGLKEGPFNDGPETEVPPPSRWPVSGSGQLNFGGQ
jgi:phospholipid/cholesterol/gamma-HCH transport system substrate-binding protein